MVTIDTQTFTLLPQEVTRQVRPAIVEHETPLSDNNPVEYLGKNQTIVRLSGFVQTPQIADPNSFLNALEALVGSHRLIRVETTTNGVYFINDIFQIEQSEARYPGEYKYQKFYYQLLAKRSRVDVLGPEADTTASSYSAPELSVHAVKATGNQVKVQIGSFGLKTANSLGNSGGSWSVRMGLYSHDSGNDRPGNLLALSPISTSYGPVISTPPSPILDIDSTSFYWVAFAYQKIGTGSSLNPLVKDLTGKHVTKTIADLNSFPNPYGVPTSTGTLSLVSQAWLGV